MKNTIIVFILLWYCRASKSDLQVGPDPWHYEGLKVPGKSHEADLPPDIRMPVKKEKQTDTKFGFGEWWFKRLLAIMLKSGKIKKGDDGSIDVSIQMRFEDNKWNMLDDYSKSESMLTDDMFRRAVGCVEEAIYKPTITDQIVMAWSDYIQVYLSEYKMYITWVFGILGAAGILIWLWKHVSHKHIIIVIFVILYIYEVIISYKEAEQKEYDKFVSAVNTCKWYFWTNECSVPPPDPILFMKHMNPLKIAIRMFTSLISEPMLAINSTVKLTIQDITDGLWFPFDKIVYGLLIVIINISLIYLLIMIVFNFIFNIPFSLNFLGIISIGVKENRRSMFGTNITESKPPVEYTDKITGDRLDKILNVCSLALTSAQNRPNTNKSSSNDVSASPLKLQRSASTGRLYALCSSENRKDKLFLDGNLKRRFNQGCGEGDH